MDKIYKNVITLIKLFNDRPYHFAKYLIDNSALTPEFIENVLNSDRLKKLESEQIALPNFTNISQMEEYYQSLIDNNLNKKTPEEIENELNIKLDDFIKNEKYEDAAMLRDYMSRKGIKRIN